MSGYQKLKQHGKLKNQLTITIVSLIGQDEMRVAELIYSRAERAGVNFFS